MAVEPQGPIVTPDPTKVALWTAQLRIVIGILAGLGFGGPLLKTITDQQLSTEITAAMTVFGFVAWAASGAWSWYKVHAAAREKHATAVASAEASAVATHAAGQPVAVTVAATETSGPASVTVTPTP